MRRLIRAPYWVRYLVALLLWAIIVMSDLFVRVWFLAFMPVLWLRSWQSQPNAQMAVSTAEFIYRPLMRFPRPLLRFRRRTARSGAKALK